MQKTAGQAGSINCTYSCPMEPKTNKNTNKRQKTNQTYTPTTKKEKNTYNYLLDLLMVLCAQSPYCATAISSHYYSYY